MRQLIALDLPGGPDFVESLRRAWDDGDAIFPVDQRLPAEAKRNLIERLNVGAIIDASGARTALDGGAPVDNGDALVVATSGSTGDPKGVVLTHSAVAASAEATSQRIGVTAGDHWLACLPLSHVGGLSVVTRAIHTGADLTVHPGFDATAVDECDANLVSLVATALKRIDASRFRTIVLGGSAPPDDRPPNTVTTYGMTETGSGVVYDQRALEGVEIRIVDDEIQLRCPMLLRCYRDDSSPLTPDGWYPTGDLGEFENGLLVVHGRRGDMIISGGENVWPEPVERVLQGVPGVADVAVVGVPDPEWGEVVVARVVLADRNHPVTLEQLREAVKAVLPSFCAPKAFTLVTRLPRTSIGKLERHRLS